MRAAVRVFVNVKGCCVRTISAYQKDLPVFDRWLCFANIRSTKHFEVLAATLPA